MKKYLSLLIILVIYTGCEGFEEVIDFGRDDGILVGYDALVPSGGEATVSARFEDITGTKGFAGETIQFVRDGSVYREVTTDAAGVAKATFSPPGAGDYEFEVRLAPSSRYSAKPVKVYVCVRDRNTRFLITDIDHTLSDASYWDVLSKKSGDIKQLSGAAKELRKISRHYSIIYLTGREDLLRRKTRIWLDNEKFPTGPLFVWNLQKDEISHRTFKTQALRRLKADWPNIEIGVGDLTGDAWAYYDNNLKKVYIVGRKEDDYEQEKKVEFPATTIFTKKWKDIRKVLVPED